MTTKTLTIALLCGAVLVGACDKEEPKASAPAPAAKPPAAAPAEAEPEQAEPELVYDDRVKTVAQVAEKIEAEPEKADEILARAELDRDKLEALVTEIASDPELIEQYRIARGT